MKKGALLLGLLAIGGIAYAATSGGTANAQVGASDGGAQDIFTLYNDRILVDKKGYWMLVKDGKLFLPDGQPSLDRYFASHPGVAQVNVDYDVWENYADKPEFIGGNF